MAEAGSAPLLSGVTHTDDAELARVHELERTAEHTKMLRHSLTVLFCYVTVGVVVYTQAGGVPRFLDALFFVVVTMTTVGYGATPHSAGSGAKIFSCAYILLGTALIASLLSFVCGRLLDRQEVLLAEAIEGAVARRAASKGRWRDHTPTAAVQKRRFEPPPHWTEETVHFVASAVVFWLFVLVGTVVFMGTDGKDFVDAFYLTVVSVTTVGYGDEAPTTDGAKIFAVLYLPVATLLLGRAVGAEAARCVQFKAAAMRERVLSRRMTAHLFDRLDADHDGRISKFEFTIATLEDEGKLEQEDVDEVLRRFHELDRSGTGYITKEDCQFRNPVTSGRVRA